MIRQLRARFADDGVTKEWIYQGRATLEPGGIAYAQAHFVLVALTECLPYIGRV